MAVEGIWIAELQRQTRPDGNPTLAPLFTLAVRREGNAITARMRDGRGDFLAASAVQTWRGVPTASGARLELPVRYVEGGRMGDFRLLYVADDVRQVANGRALIRRLELTVDPAGENLTGRWSDFWYVADRREGGLTVQVVPRPAVFSAYRSDRPIQWLGPDGPDPARVTSGAIIRPRLLHGGAVLDSLQALVTWPGGQRQVDLETAAVLERGDGPPIHVHVRGDDRDPDNGALPVAGEPPIVVRVAPGAVITVSALGRSADVVAEARPARRLTIAAIEVDQTAAQRRWAQAIAPLQSLRDDRVGEVTALEDALAAAQAAHADARAALDGADAALESVNQTRTTLVEAVETRLATLRGQRPLINLEKYLLDNEESRRAARARQANPDGSGQTPAELKRAVEDIDAVLGQTATRIREVVDQDRELRDIRKKLAASAAPREAAARALSRAAGAEQTARDRLRDAAFDLGMARTAAVIARGRAEGLEARGPRLVHAQFTTGDGVVFDAGLAPDPTLVEHFRGLLARAEAEHAAQEAEFEKARTTHELCSTTRARARRRMLESFERAQAAGESVSRTIVFNARLRQGLHWVVDVAEMLKAYGTDGVPGFIAEAAGKLLGYATQDGTQETQIFDESTLRGDYEAEYAQMAKAQAAGQTTDAERRPAKAVYVPYQNTLDIGVVAISTLKSTGLQSYQSWENAQLKIPAADVDRRAAVERATRLEARLGPTPNITGGVAAREEVIDTLRARASAQQGIMADWEVELMDATTADRVDSSRVQRARQGLQRARADFDSSQETVERLQKRLKVDRARLRDANAATREAGKKLDELIEKQKTFKGRSFIGGVAKDIGIDAAVVILKDWLNHQLDKTEAWAWQHAFESEIVYAAAVMANRRAHTELWAAEAARLQERRALQITALRLAAHRARLDDYLAGKAATGQLPVRHSAAFRTDASPLTLRLTAAGGPIGFAARLADDGPPAAAHGIGAAEPPTPTPIPVDSEMAAQLIPRGYAVAASTLEAFEDERTLTLRLTVR